MVAKLSVSQMQTSRKWRGVSQMAEKNHRNHLRGQNNQRQRK